jgi:manganese transport protein
MAIVEEAPAGSHHSLEEMHSSVAIPKTWWRRFFAFSGPALLISVGYMDPGNWGTDLLGGSTYQYRLVWVLMASNLMALLLQSLATRLGVVTGRDLAQACRESYPRATVFGLWGLSEIAIAACDLAEVIGIIIALKLLCNLPYLYGLAFAACDTLLLLALPNLWSLASTACVTVLRRVGLLRGELLAPRNAGVRIIEIVTLLLIAIIAGTFVFEIAAAKPAWGEVLWGFVPWFGPEPGKWGGSLYLAIGILGATVMPHNLYLHSALVQSRAFPQTVAGKRMACKYNFLDSFVALNGAFFVNAAILVLAAATFTEPVESLSEAHQLLKPLWDSFGLPLAAILFAVALLASGQSSTVTGTLAGQVVMEGFVRFRIRPWLRRLLTRCAALLPALLVLSLVSDDAAASDKGLLDMLVLSQVVLSFQLPFAIVPLVQFTSDKVRMGAFASRPWLKVMSWLCAAFVLVLNVVLTGFTAHEWAEKAENAGWDPLWVYAAFAIVSFLLLGFLGWVTVYPWLRRREEKVAPPPAPKLSPVQLRRIGVAVEFTPADQLVLTQAAAIARMHAAPLVLIHVVEGPVAAFYGPATDDQESRSDRADMAALVEHLREQGLKVEGKLGYGDPPTELVRVAREQALDFLVLGTHGHRLLGDLALGQTVSPVLHRLSIPILVVPSGERGS